MKPYFFGSAVNAGLTFILVLLIGEHGFSIAAQMVCLGLSGFLAGRKFSFGSTSMVCALLASTFSLFIVLSGGVGAAAVILFAELVAIGAFAAFVGISLGVKRRESLNKKLPPIADAPAE